jgi:hypothetical protein
VNRSAALVALAWPSTATVTSTVPVPAGLVPVHVVVEAQLNPVTAIVPKRAVVAPPAGSNPEPVIVTTIPPAVGPLGGLIDATVGAGRPYVKQPAQAPLSVSAFVTVTSTRLAEWASSSR